MSAAPTPVAEVPGASTHRLVIGLLAVVGVLFGAVAPEFGLDRAIAAQCTLGLGGFAGALALRWQTAPDVLDPRIQAVLARLCGASGVLSFGLGLALDWMHVSGSLHGRIMAAVGVGLQALGGLLTRSPEQQAADRERRSLSHLGAGPMLVLAMVLTGGAEMLWGGEAQAAPPTPTHTATVAAPSPVVVSAHAQLAVLHLDGSLGVGPSLCVGWRPSVTAPIYPVGCAALEIARASDGSVSGRFGPQLGVVVPAFVTQLGLTAAPTFVVGWGLLRIGPGDFVDRSKGAFAIAGSLPFLGF